MKSSNLACCCRKLPAAGLVASFFKVRCMRSWRPFCWGWPGLDALNTDPQAEPPHGELAQVEQRMCGSERHTVIAADVGGQAALLKKPLKHRESVLFPGRRKGFTGEEKPAGVVGDRQRIAVLMIPQQKLAFVIGAPQFIGSLA